MSVCLCTFAYHFSLTYILFHQMFQHLFLIGLAVIFHACIEFHSLWSPLFWGLCSLSGSWWWTGRPGVLQFIGLQRVGHDWATELNCSLSRWTNPSPDQICNHSSWSWISLSTHEFMLLSLHFATPIFRILSPSIVLFNPFCLETYFMNFLTECLWKVKQNAIFTSGDLLIRLF